MAARGEERRQVIPPVQVKVCCIRSAEEAHTAVEFGAAALGFVADEESGPWPLSDTAIAAITAGLPPAVGTFYVSACTEHDRLVEAQRATGVNTLQLSAPPRPELLRRLRGSLPGVSLVQAIEAGTEGTVGVAVETAPRVDALLLTCRDRRTRRRRETNPDWSVCRRVVDLLDKPVFLSGELLAEDSVAGALRAVHPFGIDLCRGVRTEEGRLDKGRLVAVMETVGAAAR